MKSWTIVLPMPPPTNNLYVTRGRIRVLSAKARAWKAHAIAEIALCRPDSGYFDGCKVQVLLEVYYKDGGGGDLMNREKIVTDTLVAEKVIPGDTHKIVARYVIEFAGYDKKHPLVVVTISEIAA